MEVYCVTERQKKPFTPEGIRTLKNGTRMLMGKCDQGHNCTRTIGKNDTVPLTIASNGNSAGGINGEGSAYNRPASVSEFMGRLGSALKGPRDGPSPNFRAMLKKHKDDIIKSIYIVRAPIQKHLMILLNALSLGKISERVKQFGYDDVYHLSMVMDVETRNSAGESNGNKWILLEKNETPLLDYAPDPRELDKQLGVDVIKVDAGTGIDFGTFFARTIDAIPKDYWLYSVEINNCQQFALKHLEVNGLNNPAVEKFVWQDSSELLKDDPVLLKVLRTITDTAGRFNILLEGMGRIRETIDGNGPLFGEFLTGVWEAITGLIDDLTRDASKNIDKQATRAHYKINEVRTNLPKIKK